MTITETKMNNATRKAHLVGSGIANLAAAAYLLKDGGFLPANIQIYEQDDSAGGCLAVYGNPEEGYRLPGDRMFEQNYVCLYDLMSFIPSLEDPNKSIKQDTLEFTHTYPWNNTARLVTNGKPANFEDFGFNEKDQLEMLALTAKPEAATNGKRIDELFSEHFFTINFWHMWKTLFAFNPWHSAMEFRRYLLRFMHLFPDMGRQNMLHRTRYNNGDSIVRPILNWLTKQGVQFIPNTRVMDIVLEGEVGGAVTARGLVVLKNGKEKKIDVRSEDIVIATLGSMIANSSYGSNDTVPELRTSPQESGSWALWHNLSLKRKDIFRDPAVFTDHVEQSKFLHFAVTLKSSRFFDLIRKLTGNEPGTNGIMTLIDSNWKLSFIINHQPYFYGQPKNVNVFHGMALYQDEVGNFIKKPMSQCTGREIMEEILRHLKFDADLEHILDTTILRAVQQPFGISQFLVRRVDSRPDVVPRGSTNLALTGQFVEVPRDVVYTMEYSVRSAQMAVYQLLNLDKQPTPLVRVDHDLSVLWGAFKTMQGGKAVKKTAKAQQVETGSAAAAD
jgi:oleate hydratase